MKDRIFSHRDMIFTMPLLTVCLKTVRPITVTARRKNWIKKEMKPKAKGLKPKYDGKCRELGLGPAAGSVVRLKTPLSGQTRFNDLVKGPISFNNDELDDLILKTI